MSFVWNVLIAVIAAFVFKVYNKMDYGKVIYNHRPGTCRQVHGPVHGSEDIEIIRSEGIAFVTSGLLYMQPERAHIPGKIFLYDFGQNVASAQLEARELPINGDSFDQKNFHPHGITHYVVNGIVRLYTINHDYLFQHSIEIFDFNPSGPSLTHVRSLKHSSFIRPNNLVAVGPDQFIFTNDGVTQTFLTNFIEMLTGYEGGSVYYYDGKDSHLILSGMGGPNGAAYDENKNKLFISEAMSEKINVYDLSKDKKSASLISSIAMNSTCDNLHLSPDGSIYSGCHLIMHEAAQSLGDCDNVDITSPSQVLRLKYSKDYKSAQVTEPYANDGKEVSGSSMAAIYSNQMLIGTVCKGMLHCVISDPSVL